MCSKQVLKLIITHFLVTKNLSFTNIVTNLYQLNIEFEAKPKENKLNNHSVPVSVSIAYYIKILPRLMNQNKNLNSSLVTNQETFVHQGRHTFVTVWTFGS